MIEAFNDLISILKDSAMINSTNCALYLMLIAGIYYFFKVHIPREDEKMKMFREDMIENRKVMHSFNQTLSSLDRKLDSFDTTLEKVSDKLIAHDENARGLGSGVKDLADLVSRMKEKSPTLVDFNKLEAKVEECRKENASSKDSEQIAKKLDEIMHEIVEFRNELRNTRTDK